MFMTIAFSLVGLVIMSSGISVLRQNFSARVASWLWILKAQELCSSLSFPLVNLTHHKKQSQYNLAFGSFRATEITDVLRMIGTDVTVQLEKILPYSQCIHSENSG